MSVMPKINEEKLAQALAVDKSAENGDTRKGNDTYS